MEPVRWSRGGLRWKLILVSFLYIYNNCVFFKNPVTFDLPSYVSTSIQFRFILILRKDSTIHIKRMDGQEGGENCPKRYQTPLQCICALRSFTNQITLYHEYM
jgi:hypothetical protein